MLYVMLFLVLLRRLMLIESENEGFDSLNVYCCFSRSYFIVRFPFAHLPPLSQGTNVGRSNIRKVAERRQADLQQFLNVLFEYHPEVASVSNFYLICCQL